MSLTTPVIPEDAADDHRQLAALMRVSLFRLASLSERGNRMKPFVSVLSVKSMTGSQKTDAAYSLHPRRRRMITRPNPPQTCPRDCACFHTE